MKQLRFHPTPNRSAPPEKSGSASSNQINAAHTRLLPALQNRKLTGRALHIDREIVVLPQVFKKWLPDLSMYLAMDEAVQLRAIL